jgi:hypothetical protein
MIKIVKYYLENKKRPIKYCRNQQPKESNPSVVVDTLDNIKGQGQVSFIA